MLKRSAVRISVGFFLSIAWIVSSGFSAPALDSSIAASSPPQDGTIYWGDSVPKGWNGSLAGQVPDRPRKDEIRADGVFHRSPRVHRRAPLEFSDKVTIINMFTTPLRRTGPAVVLANPRVTTPEEAAKSGKTVVYLQGNIHPYEPEAKEALLMLMRDILFGKRKASSTT